MKFAKLAKGVVTGVAVIWLAGCASTSQNAGSGTTEQAVATPKPATTVTAPVIDPKVRAVMNSGKVSGTSKQIAALLDQKVIHFAFDSDKLSTGDIKALDAQAAYLTSALGKTEMLVVEGHTDERGTRTYNLALGERRAKAVKNYLILKGVASSRIEVVSYGFEKPVDPAHTEAAWAKNRRAEIIRAGK